MERIADWLWKIPADSNCYLMLGESPTIIDTGRESNKSMVKRAVETKIPCDEIRRVICTHLHYDHIGNLDLFPNASLYASAEEIDAFKTDPEGTVLDISIARSIDRSILPLPPLPPFIIIPCPGHTIGSIALWDRRERILISGDTLFAHGYGRTDLPTSEPEKMAKTLQSLKSLPIRILCPGHEY